MHQCLLNLSCLSSDIFSSVSHLSCCNFSVQGSFTSTGLVVSSKLPRFSDMYTLIIASSDPKSVSANEPVQFTKSVTQWSLSLSLSLSLSHTHTDIDLFVFGRLKFISIHPVHISSLLWCYRFTKDGVLVEGLFWKDVEALIDQYAREPKKSKWFKASDFRPCLIDRALVGRRNLVIFWHDYRWLRIDIMVVGIDHHRTKKMEL